MFCDKSDIGSEKSMWFDKQMKTFGELVTNIKRGHLDLCNELLCPGCSQSLAPAFAYGKSFLVQQSLCILRDAISSQETRLNSLVGKESASGTSSGSDQKTWRVMDSIHQSLSLIDRYMQDPSRYTQGGITEWLKQESINFGLSTSIDSNDGSEELVISGHNFLLVLNLPDQDTVSDATVSYMDKGEKHEVPVPELADFLKNGRKDHISHLLSMAARLDILEEEAKTMPSLFTIQIPNFQSKPSVGGIKFQLIPSYETILTFDSFEQQRRIPTIVFDPPIGFPVEQLKELQDISGIRLNVEKSAAATLSQMLKLQSEVVRTIGDKAIRLNLNDDGVPSIMVARVPLASMDVFEAACAFMRRASVWCSIVRDCFEKSEELKSNNAIYIAPQKDFSFIVTYWVDEYPSSLTIGVGNDGSLSTDNQNLNQEIGAGSSFAEIVSKLVK